MEKLIGMYAPHAYALMRIIIGLLFICHGLQKVFGMFGGMGAARCRSFLSLALLAALRSSAARSSPWAFLRDMWRSSQAVKWRWHILSAISLKDSGLFKTAESWRC